MKISRELKNQIIGYVKEYAYRISNSKNQIKTMNSFDSKAAAEAVIRALKKNDAFVETETLNDPEFENYLIDFKLRII